MRTSYVERLGRFFCFRCAAIVPVASSNVKIEVGRGKHQAAVHRLAVAVHRVSGSKLVLLQFSPQSHSIVPTGERAL